jgi:hypothetical protein
MEMGGKFKGEGRDLFVVVHFPFRIFHLVGDIGAIRPIGPISRILTTSTTDQLANEKWKKINDK